MQDVPAIATDSRDPLVEAVVRAVREVRQVEPVVGGVSYGTDGAILAPAVRASMIVFGPGSPGQAHQPNEYVDLPELNHAVEAYMLIARSLLTRSTV
jgi:succinyl-diaminopimelate desuccinylase